MVSRGGSIPGAPLELLVSDGGSARCNGQGPRQIGSKRLLEAREIARDLRPEARRRVALPPGRNAVLSYRVRAEQGTVSFSDTSPGQPAVFRRVAALTRDVARRVCGLER